MDGEQTKKLLALGDSDTSGEGVAADGRWPDQLAGLLRDEGMSVGRPLIIARSGWTTADLMAAIDHEQPGNDYDLVALLIGINNQYRGLGLEEYRSEFRDLLRRAIDFADGRPGHVLVVSLPDWGVTPFAASRDGASIAAAIDAFNAVNRTEAATAGARYVDITPVSREHPDELADDKLHPSAAQYRRWAELALIEARAALGGSAP